MLIEAAQHLDKHPGPLGHFFRRLMKKKTRNVAVVAAARKLAMIGWMMLQEGRALSLRHPQEHRNQVGQARVKATGQRRKGGAGEGVKAVAKLPGGAAPSNPWHRLSPARACPNPGRFPPANNARCKRPIARRMLPRSPRRRSCRDPKAAGRPRGKYATAAANGQTAPMQALPPSRAAFAPRAEVRVPLLWFVRVIMAAIDYRALRDEVDLESVLKLLGFAAVTPHVATKCVGLAHLHSPQRARQPLVLRTPGTERLPLLPLRLGGQPARPVGRRHGATAVSSSHRPVRKAPPRGSLAETIANRP